MAKKKSIKSLLVTDLRMKADRALGKYNRNFRYYEGSVGNSIRNFRNSMPLGMNQIDPSVEWDTTPTPMLNIIKSVIDTLVSKVASVKVRPYFNPIMGDFETRKIVKELQLFFDDYFEKQEVTKKVIDAFRDACIFDKGVLWANNFTFTVDNVTPDQCSIIESEFEYGDPTKLLLVFNDFPTTHLHKYKIDVPENRLYCCLEIYYDITAHEVTLYLDKKEVRTEKYEGTQIPIIFIHYSEPAVGDRNTSLVDMLITIQMQINHLNSVIKEASQLSPAQTFFIPEGTNVTPQSVDNRIGNIIKYKPVQGITEPVHTATPNFINDQYGQLLEFYIEKAYAMAGISQLSSQSKAPQNLSSGVALQSMENIEADRFQTQVTTVVRAYTDLTKMLINIFPAKATLLPEKAKRAKITWEDVKKENEMVLIQYSAATLFSRDPAKKLQQIMEYVKAGMITPQRAGQLIEQPDLETANSLITAAIDAVDAVISNCLEKDDFSIPQYVSYDLLKKEIATEQNKLMAIGDQDEYLMKLDILDKKLYETMVSEGYIQLNRDDAEPIGSEEIGFVGETQAPAGAPLDGDFAPEVQQPGQNETGFERSSEVGGF